MIEESEILDAIRNDAATRGRAPSRAEFIAATGITEYRVLTHFSSWNAAIAAAGLAPNELNRPINTAALLTDWGNLVRTHRRIPTRDGYRRNGGFSPGIFEKRIGAWSTLPDAFRAWAAELPEWVDVLALIPDAKRRATSTAGAPESAAQPSATRIALANRSQTIAGRPTYGNPIDFRGLRHEPVNEQGVVFLFGMVARELGFLVEALQAGYPDCEAKRQVGPGKWQRVRIEFEYESRNFRDHGHKPDGCDVIICWRHNWLECPDHLEVLALCDAIGVLSVGDDAV